MLQKNLKTESFIAGEFIKNSETFPVFNPATNEKICDVTNTSNEQLEIAIQKAYTAQAEWAHAPAYERATILGRWRDLIITHKEELAQLLTAEQGKPITESRAEIGQAEIITWAAEESLRLYGKIVPAFKKNISAKIIYQPIGIVAAITPWNFPHSMITRKVAPALAAGCSVILKPAEDTPLSALALADLADRAGLPKGLLSVIPCDRARAEMIGAALLNDKRIAKLSFTGSTIIGKKLMAQAANTVKNVSLELGGNAPFIICASAHQEQAIAALIASKFRNAGQTCICANRVFVHASIFESIKNKIQDAIKKMIIGDGSNETTTLGPLINQKAIDKMHSLLNDAREKGADIVSIPFQKRTGNFYPPTLICNVSNDMQIAHEEIFGPLLALIPFDNEDDVIQKANDTDYGLAAYLHTSDRNEADKISQNLHYGMIAINEQSFVHASLPFGGMKESGIGREGGPDALKEFLQTKYIVTGLEN